MGVDAELGEEEVGLVGAGEVGDDGVECLVP